MAYTPLPTVTSDTGIVDPLAVVITGDVASNILDQYTGEMITLTKGTHKLDGGTITPGDIDNVLYFVLNGDYYVRNLPMDCVDIRWWDIHADGATDDYAAIMDAIATKKKVLFPEKTFLVGSSISTPYFNIQANKTTFIFPYNVHPCINIATPDPVTSYPAGADGVLGYNYIISTALATALAAIDQQGQGQMVLLRDNSTFTPKPSYNNYRGETKEVFLVVGDKVFFTTPLHDNYTVAQNFRVYIIDPSYCSIDGDFTLLVDQSNYNTSTQVGIELYLSYKPFLRNVKIKNATGSCIRVNTCFQADVEINVSTALRNLTGYGIAIINATCESRFSGIWSNCRHTLTTGGGASNMAGIPHNNKIYDVVSSGGDDNACIDCHPPTGFIEFENIMCTGGMIEDVDGQPGRPAGINVGAREIVIRGLTGIELGSTIVVRPEADIERLDISGVSVFNCKRLIEGTQTGILRKLHVSDVKGTLTEVALPFSAPSVEETNVKMEELIVEDCKLTCSIFLASSPFFPLPDTIVLNNVKVTGLGPLTGGSGLLLNDGAAGIKNVRLENCSFENFQYGIRINSTKNLDELTMSGSVFKGNQFHLYAFGTADGTSGNPVVRIGLFRSNGDLFAGHSHEASNTLGIFHMQRLYHKITSALIDNYVCNDEYHFFSNTTRLGGLSAGAGVSSSFISMAENIDGYEVIAGSFAAPLIMRGNGSPEGAVTAGYSTIYMQKNAAASFIKSTNSGNTGWVQFA